MSCVKEVTGVKCLCKDCVEQKTLGGYEDDGTTCMEH